MADEPKETEAPDEAEDAHEDEASAGASDDDVDEDELSEEELIARLPGRPIGPDELDPELLSLSKPRAKIGPVLAASIVLFCVYLMITLRSDLAFSRQADEPRDVDSATAVIEGDGVAVDDYIRVPAVPDRSYALRLATAEGDPGQRAMPIQGTEGKLWLMIEGSAWAAGLDYAEVYQGRVRRLADLPYADDIRRHVRGRPPAYRFVQGAEVREALAGGATSVREPGGDTLEVGPDTEVEIRETVTGKALVRAIETDRHTTEEAWTEALEEAGVVGAGARAEEIDSAQGRAWIYDVALDPADARARLAEARLTAARVERVDRVHEVAWSELDSRGDTLSVAGTAIPWSEVEWVGLMVTRSVPGDALVLLTDEEPERYWYILPLYVVLGLFAVLFAWAFVRSLRPEKEVSVDDARAELVEAQS